MIDADIISRVCFHLPTIHKRILSFCRESRYHYSEINMFWQAICFLELDLWSQDGSVLRAVNVHIQTAEHSPGNMPHFLCSCEREKQRPKGATPYSPPPPSPPPPGHAWLAGRDRVWPFLSLPHAPTHLFWLAGTRGEVTLPTLCPFSRGHHINTAHPWLTSVGREAWSLGQAEISWARCQFFFFLFCPVWAEKHQWNGPLLPFVLLLAEGLQRREEKGGRAAFPSMGGKIERNHQTSDDTGCQRCLLKTLWKTIQGCSSYCQSLYPLDSHTQKSRQANCLVQGFLQLQA